MSADPILTPEPRKRDEQLLRDTISKLCDFVWTGRTKPGTHMWTIPVDQERDFDCILSDAVDELVALRARAAELEATIVRLSEQSRAISVLLSDAGVNAMPIVEGVRTLVSRLDMTRSHETCTYCGHSYPFPVSLHHDNAECAQNQQTDPPQPLAPLTDAERVELDRLLADMLLPTLTDREREVARVVARAARAEDAATIARLTAESTDMADRHQAALSAVARTLLDLKTSLGMGADDTDYAGAVARLTQERDDERAHLHAAEATCARLQAALATLREAHVEQMRPPRARRPRKVAPDLWAQVPPEILDKMNELLAENSRLKRLYALSRQAMAKCRTCRRRGLRQSPREGTDLQR